MKMIKVIVDEIPSDCLSCMFMGIYTPDKGTDWEGWDEHYCDLLGSEVAGDGRPLWCPLITEHELLKQVVSPFNKWEETETWEIGE